MVVIVVLPCVARTQILKELLVISPSTSLRSNRIPVVQVIIQFFMILRHGRRVTRSVPRLSRHRRGRPHNEWRSPLLSTAWSGGVSVRFIPAHCDSPAPEYLANALIPIPPMPMKKILFMFFSSAMFGSLRSFKLLSSRSPSRSARPAFVTASLRYSLSAHYACSHPSKERSPWAPSFSTASLSFTSMPALLLTRLCAWPSGDPPRHVGKGTKTVRFFRYAYLCDRHGARSRILPCPRPNRHIPSA